MKIASGMLAALVLAIISASPAHAQGVPQGSYQRSCYNVGMQGDTLVAVCRRVDGRDQRTSLAAVSRCVGDIANRNGQLQCTYGQAREPADPPPGYGQPPYGQPPYGQPPGYPGREGSNFERCRELHERIERLRYRRDQAYDPGERERIEYRLREMYRDMREAGCRYD